MHKTVEILQEWGQ